MSGNLFNFMFLPLPLVAINLYIAVNNYKMFRLHVCAANSFCFDLLDVFLINMSEKYFKL